MCGIVGWAAPSSEYDSKAILKAMADCLAHRGPDDEGFFFGSGIGLGHRRLSIIDLDRGHQPMVTSDRRYAIIFNGEVYNHPAIRSELEKKGEAFVTESDTEVLLKAFQYWGTNAFVKFQGMFSIAIWDEEEKTLHLVRDHLGIKPLYYAEIGGTLLFASEIKALFSHPALQRRMNPEVVSSFLAFNNTFGSESFWSGVKKCKPGEHLVWRDGTLKNFLFFDLESLEVEPFKGSFEDAAERYAELLSDSVTDHLISDVPVGAYLSSGIDSSSVASMAARKIEGSLPVFTGYFEGNENNWYDERNGAKAVSQKESMEHHHCAIRWDDFYELFDKVSYHLDEPTLGSGFIPQYLVAQKAKKEVKVVLSGHGGDELFAGYPVFKSSLIRENGVGIESLLSLRRVGGFDEWLRIMYFLVGGVLDPVRARGQFRMFSSSGLRKILTPTTMNTVRHAGGFDSLLDRNQPFLSKPNINGVTKWYLGTYLPTLLVQEDKVSMAHGLETRTPICYEPIVRFSLSLLGKVKLNQGVLKAVPRKAIVSWLTTKLGEEWECCWKDSLPSALDGILNVKEVQKEFSNFRKWGYKMPHAYPLAHRLVSLQVLHATAKTLQKIKPVNLNIKNNELDSFSKPNFLDEI